MASDNIGVSDIEEVFMILGVHRLKGFPSSGAIFTSTPLNPAKVAAFEGLDGELSLTKRIGKTKRIEITLARTSQSNGVMWGLLKVQENLPGLTPLPFVLTHRATKFVSANCVIEEEPTLTIGDGEQTMVWKLLAGFFEGTITGLTMQPILTVG